MNDARNSCIRTEEVRAALNLSNTLAEMVLVKNSRLKIYPGGSHGLSFTHTNQLNSDLLEFANS